MYRRVIKSGQRDIVAVHQHRAFQNQYNNLYRQNKNMYFQEHLAEYRDAPRPFWKAERPPNNFSLTQSQPVTARRVKDLIMKMNDKKAAGHDGICSKELKVVAEKLAWQLAILFNESLESSEIPSDFKIENIMPIFKSGKKQETAPENCRGIFLTPLVSKVLERIVFNEVSAFLSNRKLLGTLTAGTPVEN